MSKAGKVARSKILQGEVCGPASWQLYCASAPPFPRSLLPLPSNTKMFAESCHYLMGDKMFGLLSFIFIVISFVLLLLGIFFNDVQFNSSVIAVMCIFYLMRLLLVLYSSWYVVPLLMTVTSCIITSVAWLLNCFQMRDFILSIFKCLREVMHIIVYYMSHCFGRNMKSCLNMLKLQLRF